MSLAASHTHCRRPAENSDTAHRNALKKTPFFSPGLSFFQPAAHIQPKLTVNAPDDIYEKEADAVADQVMRMPNPQIQRQEEEEEMLQMKEQEHIPAIQRKCAACKAEESVQRQPVEEEEEVMMKLQPSLVQRKCAECEEEDKLQRKPLAGNITPLVQRKATGGGEVNRQTAASLQSTKGGGRALPEHTRNWMESRFGADFSGVKVHTDSKAVQLSRELNAQAFTHGNDIYFNRGKFAPGTSGGKRLLAHELTHVVQKSVIPNVDKKSDSDAVEKNGTMADKSTQHLHHIGTMNNLILRQHNPAHAIEMPEETFTSSQSTADARLRSIHEQFRTPLLNYFLNWNSGLSNFQTNMKFASDQEATPQMLRAIGGALFKSAIDIGIDAIELTPLKHAIKTAINVGTAAVNEAERASAATGQRRIASYITSLQTKISNSRTAVTNTHDQQLNAFLAEFPGDRSRRVLSESEEAWIAQAEQGLSAFRGSVPGSAIFLQRITERFADTGGYVGLVTRGTWRSSGTLSINIRVSGSLSGSWSVDSIDDHWVLGTRAPNPDRVAQNLKESLEGYSPMFSNLPKIIRILANSDTGTFRGNMAIQGAFNQNPRWHFTYPTHGLPGYERDSAMRERRRHIIEAVMSSGTVARELLTVSNIEGSDR